MLNRYLACDGILCKRVGRKLATLACLQHHYTANAGSKLLFKRHRKSKRYNSADVIESRWATAHSLQREDFLAKLERRALDIMQDAMMRIVKKYANKPAEQWLHCFIEYLMIKLWIYIVKIQHRIAGGYDG